MSPDILMWIRAFKIPTANFAEEERFVESMRDQGYSNDGPVGLCPYRQLARSDHGFRCHRVTNLLLRMLVHMLDQTTRRRMVTPPAIFRQTSYPLVTGHSSHCSKLIDFWENDMPCILTPS